MTRQMYTKIVLLLSFLLLSSANSELTLSNLAHKIQNSANSILFHPDEPTQKNANLGPILEEDRFPQLPPDVEAKLRAYTANENAMFIKKRKEVRAAEEKAARTVTHFRSPQPAKPANNEDTKKEEVRPTGGLRGRVTANKRT